MELCTQDREVKARILGLPWLNRVVTAEFAEVHLSKWTLWRRRLSECCRLGASYNLFDGEELLEASARSIRKQVGFINVVYQDVSNCGEKREPLAPMLELLKAKGVVDSYVRYDPDLSLLPHENESRKRRWGLKICRQRGCTHYLDMDVDEFYRDEELVWAKMVVVANRLAISACTWYDYVKSSKYRFLVPSVNYVPLITKIPRLLFKTAGEFPCSVDGTRSIVRKGRFYLFPRTEISMHHMSYVRKDLDRKLRNSSLVVVDEAKESMLRTKEILCAWTPGANVTPPNIDFAGEMPILCVPDEFGVEKL